MDGDCPNADSRVSADVNAGLDDSARADQGAAANRSRTGDDRARANGGVILDHDMVSNRRSAIQDHLRTDSGMRRYVRQRADKRTGAKGSLF